MQHTTIAVDLAKSVFQVAVSHHTGRVDEEHRLTRARFLRFFAPAPGRDRVARSLRVGAPLGAHPGTTRPHRPVAAPA